ncbi:adhesion G protein-coupled receptor B2 [Trichonephila clavipes]|nr:adhesion G protein-coupled receptor B2 [Trichonephila clavipes]
MLDCETATHIGVLQGEEWYKPRDLGKQCDIFYASKGKSYDGPKRAKWNDSEKRSFNDKHFKRDCPKNKGVDNKRLNVDKVSTEGTELEDGAVAARVDLLDILVALHFKYDFWHMTATAGSDVVQSGRPIFDDFFQHLWPYIGNNTANVVFQMVKRLRLISIDQ